MKRSKYLGVYHNFDNDLPYRVAIKRFVNGIPKYTHCGYFHTEKAAAFVFDVYAITTFRTGAVLNVVSLNEQEAEEVNRYKDTNPDFCKRAEDALDIANELKETGNHHVKRNPKLCNET